MAEKNLYTVIVADDEDELREAVCTMIPWEASVSTWWAVPATGLDALELVEQLEPDLLLTDIRMPFITGLSWPPGPRDPPRHAHCLFKRLR